jgi:hypothetical protein
MLPKVLNLLCCQTIYRALVQMSELSCSALVAKGRRGEGRISSMIFCLNESADDLRTMPSGSTGRTLDA